MKYLAGKITDTSPEKERENIDRFYTKAKELEGEVYNPVVHEAPGMTWEQYLAYDLKKMMELPLTGIYMMKGWEDSKGARLELEFAKLLGLEIEYEVS